MCSLQFLFYNHNPYIEFAPSLLLCEWAPKICKELTRFGVIQLRKIKGPETIYIMCLIR